MPITVSAIRPNRISDKKDESYHVRYARWAIGNTRRDLHEAFVLKCMINWSFYSGKQWVYEEDLDVFLKDDTGNVRNRIRMTKNVIKPMVNQFIGNTIETDFSVGAIANSSEAETRRDLSLLEMLHTSKVSRQLPKQLSDTLKEKYPIGDNDIETKQNHSALYRDQFAEKVTQLCKIIAEDNDIEDIKIRLAKSLALTGLTTVENTEINGEMVSEVVDSKYFFWDRSAEKPDLSDSQFKGRYYMMGANDIFERYPNIKDSARTLLENYVTREGDPFGVHYTVQTSVNPGRIPVYKVYWRDTDKQEWGYVNDEFGSQFFTRINYKEEGQDNPAFTDKDLISVKDIPASLRQKFKGGKKKALIHRNELRYCIFIPAEIVGGVDGKDVVLEYGEVPYTDSKAEYPILNSTWSYENGEVLTPIDDVIDPQRFINRCLSVMESHVNNSGGSGAIIDSDMLEGTPEEATRAMRNNDPLYLKANGQMNNAVGTYDMSMKNSADVFMRLQEGITKLVQDVTGVTDTMKGTAGGYRQLVGVQEIQIQRGSLLQEPFYYALTRQIKGIYKDYARRGVKIYCDSRRRLSQMVGESWAQTFYITKDMTYEEFSISFKRISSEADQINFVNNQILTFAQIGYLDQDQVAKLWGRGDQFMLSIELRKYAEAIKLQKRETEKANAQQVAGQQQQQGQMMQQQQLQGIQDRADTSAENEANRQNELDKIMLNNMTKHK